MKSTWNAPIDISKREATILKLTKKQKLWGFLREYRHILLDEEIQHGLASMYETGAAGGRPPQCPERLLLAMLLQVAFGVADHEVPTLTVVDSRWQMVLDCHGIDKPAFSQGTVFHFRERARESGLMNLLLDKTVMHARETKGYCHKRLRGIFDSSPLTGAGRVEDTFNLLGRAIAELLQTAAREGEVDPGKLAEELQISVFLSSSTKAALDLDWNDPDARSVGLKCLIDQFDQLHSWLKTTFESEILKQPPMCEQIETIERIIDQDTEPDPDCPGSGSRRISQGVTPDRLISLSDKEMRHGRKTKTKTVDGYKRHICADADVAGLICAVSVLPANRHEHEAVKPLIETLEKNGFELTELHVDRGYIPSPELVKELENGLPVISKPPSLRRTGRFTKEDFDFDFQKMTITCPAGQTIALRLGKSCKFAKQSCQSCPLKKQCTTSARSRALSVHPREEWYQEMRDELSTSEGRALRRQRVSVEHRLARVGAIQGRHARYRGREKNEFDLQRAAVLNNVFVLGNLLKNAA